MSSLWQATASKARARLRRFITQELQATFYPIDKPVEGGFLDLVRVDPAGIISIQGWSRTKFDSQAAPTVLLDSTAVPFIRSYRTRRPDVSSASDGIGAAQAGFELSYLISESMIGQRYRALTLQLQTGESFSFEVDLIFLYPDYRVLLSSNEVLHRNHIYGSGPPNVTVHPHLVELAKRLPGPVLDFGCGRGALMRELLKSGTEAYGLEIDSEMLRGCIPEEHRHLITLYDGTLPSPFSNGQFRSVVCSEVLEHIPDYQAAIRDIARLASEQALFTVPDASAIPIGFRHGSVPWHLMEATHVNFFNQESLENALKPHFSTVEFGRIGQSRFNDSPYYVSLAALCRK